MVVVLDFTFEDYKDFSDFLKKHDETIDKMAEGERPLTEQIREQVRTNRQFPENFEFTDAQYTQMVRKDSSGMQKLAKDDRVDVKRSDDSG